jgi:PST family polysaccharide transporter
MSTAADSYFEDHKGATDLGRLALRSGIASVAMQYGNALQIVAAIVLARLLAPEDFGLVATIAVLTSFAPAIIDFGLADATVQKANITRGHVSSFFGSVLRLDRQLHWLWLL